MSKELPLNAATEVTEVTQAFHGQETYQYTDSRGNVVIVETPMSPAMAAINRKLAHKNDNLGELIKKAIKDSEYPHSHK